MSRPADPRTEKETSGEDKEIGVGRTTENPPAPPTTELADQLQFAARLLSEKLVTPTLGVVLPSVMITVRRRRSAAGSFMEKAWFRKAETSDAIAQIELNPSYFHDAAGVLQTLTHELSHHTQETYPNIFGKPGKG